MLTSCWQVLSEVELRRTFAVCKRWAKLGFLCIFKEKCGPIHAATRVFRLLQVWKRSTNPRPRPIGRGLGHLQTSKMSSSRTSAQNNGPRAQNNEPRAHSILPKPKMLFLYTCMHNSRLHTLYRQRKWPLPVPVRKIIVLRCKIMVLGCKMFYQSVWCFTHGLRDFEGTIQRRLAT